MFPLRKLMHKKAVNIAGRKFFIIRVSLSLHLSVYFMPFKWLLVQHVFLNGEVITKDKGIMSNGLSLVNVST